MRRIVFGVAVTAITASITLSAEAQSPKSNAITITCHDYLRLSKAARLDAYKTIAKRALRTGTIAPAQMELVQGSLDAPVPESEGGSADLAIAALALQASCQRNVDLTASDAFVKSVGEP